MTLFPADAESGRRRESGAAARPAAARVSSSPTSTRCGCADARATSRPSPARTRAPGPCRALYQGESFVETLLRRARRGARPGRVHAGQPAGVPRCRDGARGPAALAVGVDRHDARPGAATRATARCCCARPSPCRASRARRAASQLAVEAVFGLRAEVQETGASPGRWTPTRRSPASRVQAFVVQVFATEGQTVDEQRLDLVVSSLKPAHVVHRRGEWSELESDVNRRRHRHRADLGGDSACSRRVAAAEPRSPIRSWISASSAQAESRSGSSSVARRASGRASAGVRSRRLSRPRSRQRSPPPPVAGPARPRPTPRGRPRSSRSPR